MLLEKLSYTYLQIYAHGTKQAGRQWFIFTYFEKKNKFLIILKRLLHFFKIKSRIFSVWVGKVFV